MDKLFSPRENGGANLHLHSGPKINDTTMATLSCEIDAALDREWLNNHPDAPWRERPASVRERKAFGLAVGMRAVIFRGPNGRQIRMFHEPSANY